MLNARYGFAVGQRVTYAGILDTDDSHCVGIVTKAYYSLSGNPRLTIRMDDGTYADDAIGYIVHVGETT